jgi:hypothetical protein
LSCLSVRRSVRMEQLGSHWTDCHEIWYLSVFRKSVNRIKVLLKYDKIKGYLREDVCKFMIIYRWILRRMRNVSDKICTENRNMHFIFSNLFPKIVPFLR